MVGSSENKPLVVPRVINLMLKITQYKVPAEMISTLHFNDLLLLLMNLDIRELEQAIKVNSKKDRNVKDVSSEQAVKFLKS